MRLMEYAGVPGMEKHLMTAVVREEESDSGKPRKAPHVVIVGAGFGGLQAAKALQQAPVQVTVIDSNNHHLFKPSCTRWRRQTCPLLISRPLFAAFSSTRTIRR